MSTLSQEKTLITQNPDHSLISQAQRGCAESMDLLADQVQGRLYSYVYRCTLDSDTSNDIVQETLIEMVRLLGKLRHADQFWAWLRAIAYNKIRNQRRKEQHRRGVSLSEVGSDLPPERDPRKCQEGLAELMSQELKQNILSAMREIKPQYRDVLSMRCYEDMEYEKIAKLMDRSPFAVRMMFVRAKRALANQLSRRGVTKGSLVTALALFGKITAPSEAAAAQVSVTAATLKVGAAATLAGAVTTGTGATVAVLAVSALTVVTTLGVKYPETFRNLWPQSQKATNSFEVFTSSSAAEGQQELWYYLPEGREGPVMMRLAQKRGESGIGRAGYHWLQNQAGNYFYDRDHNTIYINNFHTWQRDLRVRVLPTDEPSLRRFLARDQGISEVGFVPVSGDAQGLLVIAGRESPDGSGYQVQPNTPYNILHEEYFRYNWPPEAKVFDARDAMHRRGWTVFRIRGEIGGHPIQGAGQIPFVYEASGEYPAWLRLESDGRLLGVDTPTGAAFYPTRGGKNSWAGGSLFIGLSRPWMGLHTIDTIRRDAARYGIRFVAEYQPPEHQGRVKLFAPGVTMVYTIDMEKDMVESISFLSGPDGSQSVGFLEFTYFQDLPAAGSEFVRPKPNGRSSSKPDGFWLLSLPQWIPGS
jgi:RNA polymerase sigma-70 factor, ECF subfamily